MFDIEFFKIDPGPFYRFASSLIGSQEMKPSVSHCFIAELEKRRKLLRNFTQNVDGLEKKAGVKKVVECHGSMASFHCLKCRHKENLQSLTSTIIQGEICYCKCSDGSNVLKPDVTFFGELLSSEFHRSLDKDPSQCDLVIVIGTSLKVGGAVHEVIRKVDRDVPQILINRDAVSLPKNMSEGFDITILGKCDDVISYISDCLGWHENHSSIHEEILTNHTVLNESQIKQEGVEINSNDDRGPKREENLVEVENKTEPNDTTTVSRSGRLIQPSFLQQLHRKRQEELNNAAIAKAAIKRKAIHLIEMKKQSKFKAEEDTLRRRSERWDCINLSKPGKRVYEIRDKHSEKDFVDDSSKIERDLECKIQKIS